MESPVSWGAKTIIGEHWDFGSDNFEINIEFKSSRYLGSLRNWSISRRKFAIVTENGDTVPGAITLTEREHSSISINYAVLAASASPHAFFFFSILFTVYPYDIVGKKRWLGAADLHKGDNYQNSSKNLVGVKYTVVV